MSKSVVVSLLSRISRRVHRKKVVSCDVLTFPLQGGNHSGPRRVRNAFPGFPLLDSPVTLPNISRHLGDGAPALENVVDGLHGDNSAPDELSGQGRLIIPLTGRRPKRTIRPMGRGSTPVRFRSELAQRLKSARIMARFETQQDAAIALGVGLDRYRKWESGRTPVPAQYVPLVCQLFKIDANYLYSVPSMPLSKVG